MIAAEPRAPDREVSTWSAGPPERSGIVFYVSVLIAAGFSIWGLAWPGHLSSVATGSLGFATKNFGWFYLAAANTFVGFCGYLIFSRHGDVRLGRDDERPEYSYCAWLAMLFSAGMGIGLVFWGVAEPMYHFQDPPMGMAASQSPEAARMALRYSFFHWCLHPWAIYAVIGLAVAHSQFRKGESGLISGTFRSLLGKRVDGHAGRAIDILAALATVFGVATSLGLGALQIAGGLEHLFGLANTRVAQMLIIGIVTVLFLISAVTGLNKGILYLSQLNMILAGLLLCFVLALGPTVFVLEALTTVVGGYLQNIVQMSFRLSPFSQGEWVGSWTLFYWAWWIAWAPFVGTFIARVSRGRTVRQFVAGVLLVPSALCALWFAVFGGVALHADLFHGAGIANAVQNDISTALFQMLGQLPWGHVAGFLAGILIVTFFVTSADSATFVLGMLTSKGHPNPATSTKIVWGGLQSFIAAALLLSGGLKGLQTASIVVALPFGALMLVMIVALLKSLRAEPQKSGSSAQHHRSISTHGN